METTLYSKDTTPCAAINNKVRIFGILQSNPEQYYDTNLFYVKLNCPISISTNIVPINNNLIVCMNLKTKQKYFDSGVYNINDPLIVHGSTRNFMRTIVKRDGTTKMRDEYFVMMEKVHRYPNRGQVFLKNNIGIAIGTITRYCPRTSSLGVPYVDVVLKVDREPYYNMLNLSTIGRPMQKVMHTKVGDEVGFKYNLKAYCSGSGHGYMRLNTFYMSTDPEKYYSEQFQDFDFVPEKKVEMASIPSPQEYEHDLELRRKFLRENDFPEDFFYDMKPLQNDGDPNLML